MFEVWDENGSSDEGLRTLKIIISRVRRGKKLVVGMVAISLIVLPLLIPFLTGSNFY